LRPIDESFNNKEREKFVEVSIEGDKPSEFIDLDENLGDKNFQKKCFLIKMKLRNQWIIPFIRIWSFWILKG
jgi:hypothetical protein